jgi:hypothetical protein
VKDHELGKAEHKHVDTAKRKKEQDSEEENEDAVAVFAPRHQAQQLQVQLPQSCSPGSPDRDSKKFSVTVTMRLHGQRRSMHTHGKRFKKGDASSTISSIFSDTVLAAKEAAEAEAKLRAEKQKLLVKEAEDAREAARAQAVLVAAQAEREQQARAQQEKLYRAQIQTLVVENQTNHITEQFYYVLRWLYRIRNASCRRGVRIRFLQPDFIRVLFGPYMPGKKCLKNDANFLSALNLWTVDPLNAEVKHGSIDDWDLTSVTKNAFSNMSSWDQESMVCLQTSRGIPEHWKEAMELFQALGSSDGGPGAGER